MLEKFYVYMIANLNNKKITTYVGWTKNLKKRLCFHNTGKELNLLEEESGF